MKTKILACFFVLLFIFTACGTEGPAAEDPATKETEYRPYGSYADTKALIELRAGRVNEESNIDVDTVISAAYDKYTELIDKDIVNPDFVKVLIYLGGSDIVNPTNIDEKSLEEVNGILSENGLEELVCDNAASSVEAGMIFASYVAKENGYGKDKQPAVIYQYFSKNYNAQSDGKIARGTMYKELFKEMYYPNFPDAPA